MRTPTLSLTREEVQQRRVAVGWSQSELARRIRRNPGYVSKVLAGLITSAVVWGQIEQALTREEQRRRRVVAAGRRE